MADELKFDCKIEYAKSDRSSCKKCASTINKDAMRIGKLTISDKFDGEIYVWHHVKCFFGMYKAKLQNSSCIKGLSIMRWEDQQKIIKTYFPTELATAEKDGSSSTPAEEEEKEKGSSYSAEYAKSGRSTCKICSKKIENKSLRIEKKEYTDDGHSVQFFAHFPCLKIPSWMTSKNIFNFENLEAGDQQKIQTALDAVSQSKQKTESSSSSPTSSSSSSITSADPQKQKQQQIKLFYQKRDQVDKEYATADLKRMLRENDYYDKGGRDDLLLRVTDGFMNGAIPRCPSCGGRMEFDSESGYRCRSYATSFSRCNFTCKEIDRKQWKVPNWEEDEVECRTSSDTSGQTPLATDQSVVIMMDTPPLQGLQFLLVGNDLESVQRESIRETITDQGGVICESFSSEITHVIATEEFKNEASKLHQALDKMVPYYSPSSLSDLIQTRSSLLGKRKPPRKNEDGEGAGKRINLKRKRVAKVDQYQDEYPLASVVADGEDAYDVTMNMTELNVGQRGRNSFYVMQLLKQPQSSVYGLLTRWGRVGDPGNYKIEEFKKKETAVHAFCLKFSEKTGNQWDQRDVFVKCPGKFMPIMIDDDSDSGDGTIVTNLTEEFSNKSALAPRVRRLISIIFDMEMFASTMKKMDLDIKKLPLGKLSKSQLHLGIQVLSEIETELKKEQPDEFNLQDATNRFYTFIPHYFEGAVPPTISNNDILKTKFEHLEVLADIQVAAAMLKDSNPDEDDPFLAKFHLLQNDIRPLEHDSSEWQYIELFIKNTMQKPEMKLIDVFRLNRQGEEKRFSEVNDLQNRKLLWHGSKVAVFASILSGGLKIMPHSGGRVGRGLYFADIISKSSAYCGLNDDKIGLMLLNEVALGKIHEINRDDSSLVRAPKGYDSVLATGTIMPDPAKDITDDSLSISGHPVVIPQGKLKNKKLNSSFYHNEFLVYNENQVHMKYLLIFQWP